MSQIAKLFDAGIPREVGDRSRNKRFLAVDVIRAVEGPRWSNNGGR